MQTVACIRIYPLYYFLNPFPPPSTRTAMIGYVTLGTNNFERAAAFYDDLLSVYGAKRTLQTDKMILWSSAKPGRPSLGIIKPYDKNPATVGNGAMVALGINEPAKVDELYKKALALGATDEGAPGSRGGSFYGAYFRDLDGNKLCVFCMVKE
jgi:catechol 2,3-dioxygenase-like lactoylglutathione lyase family enzyme